MINNKIYYNGSTSHCTITEHSCRRLGVKRGSSFSLLDPGLVVYEPCTTGGRDNSGVNLTRYELINRSDD